MFVFIYYIYEVLHLHMYLNIFTYFFPDKNYHPLSIFSDNKQYLLGMKYDKCISYKNGSIGKGQHARGQYCVPIDSSRIVVHPTIENDGPR